MRWYKNIWRPKKMGILFIQFNRGEKSYTVIKISNERCSFITCDSLAEVSKATGKQLPYHVHVSGTGVLSRKVEYFSNYRDALIVSGDPKEFIFTDFHDTSTVAASFFRCDSIQNELQFLKEARMHVLGISCGDVPGFNLLQNEQLELDMSLELKNNLIVKYERNKAPQLTAHFRDIEYKKQELIARGIYLSYREQQPNYTHKLFSDAKENYINFTQFRTYGVGVLLTLLISLIGNYWYQNKLNSDVAQLELDLSLSNDNLTFKSIGARKGAKKTTD